MGIITARILVAFLAACRTSSEETACIRFAPCPPEREDQTLSPFSPRTGRREMWSMQKHCSRWLPRASGDLQSTYFDAVSSLSDRKLVSSLPAVTLSAKTSRLECVLRCRSQDTCSYIVYAAASQRCTMTSYVNVTMGDTEPANEPTEIFTRVKVCPAHRDGIWYDEGSALCFKLSDTAVNSWEEAVEACRAQNMELIKLDTPERQAAVMEVFKNNPDLRQVSGTSLYVYIGAARPKEWWGNTSAPDTYYWLDGAEVVWGNSQYWGPTQPNGYGTEECLGIYPPSFHIYDRRTDDNSRYICQL